MNPHQLERVLSRLAEQQAPGGVDLWPGIRERIEARSQRTPKGDLSMNIQRSRRRRLSLASIYVFALAAAVTLIFTTPEGRALGQEVLRFFTRLDKDAYPRQVFLMTPHPTAVNEEAAYDFAAHHEVASIEAQTGFDVLEPTWLPEIVAFEGATLEEGQPIVRIFYTLDHNRYATNGIVLKQQPIPVNPGQGCDLCQTVGASAEVEQVQINDAIGEYVEGVWKFTDEGAVWESDPYLKTLRWQANGMAFELMTFAPPDLISKEDMAKVAASLK